jgi:hypothetical protein
MIASRVWAHAVAVGAAVAQRGRHPPAGVGGHRAGGIEDGADSAHAPHLGSAAVPHTIAHDLVARPSESCHARVWNGASKQRTIP